VTTRRFRLSFEDLFRLAKVVIRHRPKKRPKIRPVIRALTLLMPIVLLAQRPVPVDNEWARVVIATTSPGPKGRMHEHPMNRVMVYLDKGEQTIEYEDGRSKTIASAAGQVFWDPKGGRHTSQNTGGSTFRIVEIELKKEPGRKSSSRGDALRVSTWTHGIELENEQVRVVRVKLGAHAKISKQAYWTPFLLVPLTDMAIGGRAKPLHAKSGDAIFFQQGSNAEKNTLNHPVEYLIIEFKD
jgi:quercetin dioxygenase-like cupin family protein